MSNGKNSSKNSSNILEQIDIESQKQNPYLKIEDGENRKLKFSIDPPNADPDKIKIVDNEFDGKPGKRVEYKVTDLDRPELGEKILSMPLFTANIISGFLKREKYTLEIQKIGSGKRTRYNISAV